MCTAEGAEGMVDGIVMGRTENPLTISGSAAVEDNMRCRFGGRGFVIAGMSGR